MTLLSENIETKEYNKQKYLPFYSVLNFIHSLAMQATL